MFIKGNSMFEDASMVRGFFINETIFIERIIDDIFSRFFCDTYKKGHVLKEMFLSTERITFEMKRQGLKHLLNKLVPSPADNDELLFPYLTAIMEYRNVFAHYELDLSDKALKKYPKELGFVKYKNETKTIWYNDMQLQLHYDKITYCHDLLATI
jgi:hypothetical protein